MATVVTRGADNRGVMLLSAVAGFLSGMKDKRLDSKQAEMMKAMSEANSEQEAAALYGDPYYEEITGDPERFDDVLRGMQQLHPGFQTLPGYTEDGALEYFSVPKGADVNAETFSSRNLHPERTRMFYADDLTKDEDFPLQNPAGAFRSRGEAERAYRVLNPDAEFNVLDQAAANIASQAASMTAQNRRADIDSYLSQERFRIDTEKGYTPFSNLEYDFKNGLIDQAFYEAAKKRLTWVSGLTPDDIASEYLKDAPDDWANVENMSQLFQIMVDNVIADPRIITDMAAVPRLIAKIGAELSTIASLTGMTRKNIDDYNWTGLAATSTEMKGMLLDAAMVSAKADDQTARSLSDKDLDRFLDRVGRNISDVPSFVRGLVSLANRQQRGFHNRYRAHTGDDWSGTPFTVIKYSSAEVDEQFNKNLVNEFEGLILPENVPGSNK